VLLLITGVLYPLLETISSTKKTRLTILVKELAQDSTVEEKGEWLEIIEFYLSRALGPLVTVAQSRAATRFMSILREGSSTINEVTTLMAEHERSVQERDGVPISSINCNANDGTTSPLENDLSLSPAFREVTSDHSMTEVNSNGSANCALSKSSDVNKEPSQPSPMQTDTASKDGSDKSPMSICSGNASDQPMTDVPPL
jgi:hypothetical protein